MRRYGGAPVVLLSQGTCMIINAIEGIDFVGKTTQLHLLHDNLNSVIYSGDTPPVTNQTILVRNPESCSFGNSIKSIILDNKVSEMTRFLLFQGAYSDIIDKLSSHQGCHHTIWDRTIITGVVYSNLDFKLGAQLCHQVSKFNFITNLVILVITRDALLDRMQGVKLDYIESKGVDYLLNLQTRMLEFINYLQETLFILNVLQIDATLPQMTILQKILDFYNLPLDK